MKEIRIIGAIFNGLIRLAKAIRCKSVCCVKSSCNEPTHDEEHIECKFKDNEGNDRVYVV